jgi:hypothetical protein
MAEHESISFGEGIARLWTGTASAYVMAHVENVNVSMTRSWLNYLTLGGYRDLSVGLIAEVNIGAVWTYDNSLSYLWASATAVHMELYNSNAVAPSAGMVLWSGRIDNLTFNGAQGDVMRASMAYHSNAIGIYGSAR